MASVDRYTAAVKLLFDPDNAQVDLLSLEVQVIVLRLVFNVPAVGGRGRFCTTASE